MTLPVRTLVPPTSVVPHLFLDKSFAEKPGVEGMKYVMSPPLRNKRNQKVLLNALSAGLIDGGHGPLAF